MAIYESSVVCSVCAQLLSRAHTPSYCWGTITESHWHKQ